jgi:hypothetical protein
MILTIDPFQQEDAQDMAVQPMQMIGRSASDNADTALQLAAPGRAFTIRDRTTRRILCIAGLAEQYPHWATGWALLAADKGGGAMLAITRAVRWFLAKGEFRVVDCLIHAEQVSARRWAAVLGFRPEARLAGRAPDGGDIIIYTRTGAE